MNLAAAFAIGTSLQRARVNSPSLLRVAYPYIRPIQQGNVPANDPNMMVLRCNQLLIPAGEPVGIDVVTANAGDLVITLLWFTNNGAVPLPKGDGYWLRYTAPTSNQTPGSSSFISPLRWSQLVPVFDQTIPAGTYAVTGFEHTGTAGGSAIAARLVFPGSVYRPGTVATQLVTERTSQYFYDGAFGVLGTFQTISPPSIEVLCTSPDTVAHEGYIRVVRIADLAALRVDTNLSRQQLAYGGAQLSYQGPQRAGCQTT
jgi:hypothetical protein